MIYCARTRDPRERRELIPSRVRKITRGFLRLFSPRGSLLYRLIRLSVVNVMFFFYCEVSLSPYRPFIIPTPGCRNYIHQPPNKHIHRPPKKRLSVAGGIFRISPNNRSSPQSRLLLLISAYYVDDRSPKDGHPISLAVYIYRGYARIFTRQIFFFFGYDENSPRKCRVRGESLSERIAGYIERI